mmetsp:Transcript_19443/g.49689  ORF Transcript_19443/g.49689 Transcript_19443/m.49689 type:complete len:439 (-) Transcript_19443:314-1630(-)
MLNMVQLSSIISIDKGKKQATVQAGARVTDVVEALRPHGLTLQNYASIAEQQIGGFIQVGAHGTGAGVPPVDEQVIRLKLHTPALGALELSTERNPELFRLARVGLGWLGIVSEVTLQCVPAHKLIQHTFVETREGIQRRHEEFLSHQHMRYMWIPHTDTVVVVTCDPVPEDAMLPPKPAPSAAAAAPEGPLRQLLLKKAAKAGKPMATNAVDEMSFAQLRDALIAIAPLDKQHIIEINRAEAQFWQASEGFRIDWSDRLLGFECGGQQWVSEIAFPCGTLQKPDRRDLAYMTELLGMIEQTDLPTPAPIEQRWTRRSSSPMSPAYSDGANDLHSWVGIIMYLPTDEPEQRAAITKRFWEYNKMCRDNLWAKYGCHQHWAKIEIPASSAELAVVRKRLSERYPLRDLWSAKQQLDPKGVLGNALIDTLLLPDQELARR